MATGIELIITRPSADIPWYEDYLDAQTAASFDPIKASRQRVEDAYTNSSTLKVRHVTDPADPLTLKMQFNVSGLPTNDIELAYVYLRKAQKELFDSINDAPFTETAEQSFDGVARVYPACLFVEKRRQWFNLNEFRVSGYNYVDVDF